MEALIVISSILLIIVFRSNVKTSDLNKKLKKEIDQLNAEFLLKEQSFEDFKQKAEEYKKNTEYLKKFEEIKDVEAEKDRIIVEANQISDDIKSEAKNILDESKQLAIKIEQDTRQKTNKISLEAENSLKEATKLAITLKKEAKQKAKDIAGEAWDVKDKASHYKKTVKAMKNLIEGYGDEYLIPNQSLLDDLAEEYSHEQAGAELVEVRKLIRYFITNNIAAECDYVATSRKTTAISFVIDAFNGKVDTIMSRVKHNNYGKLHQALEDAFYLVNYNGKAFRNARVSEDYFELMEKQLKLSVMIQELKKRDQAEQKRIRQEMRKEEKARREYEKALKEAAKEEKMLAKAMKLAEAKLSAAAEEERAKFEQEISRIKAKLAFAEEKNQRAVSMAQQTKSGHVYIISNIGSFGENVLKIGLTRRLNPMDRVKELGDASVPFQFDVHAMIYAKDAPELEKKLHETFHKNRVNKVNYRKEFFNVSITEIKAKFKELGLEAHWTMKAEALEYRESLALAKKDLLLIKQN